MRWSVLKTETCTVKLVNKKGRLVASGIAQNMTDAFELDKLIWTDADYDQMGWHDGRIYAVSMLPETSELLLDIDYIFDTATGNDGFYDSYVSPCTLVFENVHTLEFDIGSADCRLEITNLTRTNPVKPINFKHIQQDVEWSWLIDCPQGEIRLSSIGFKQYVRRLPARIKTQHLGLESREGISFHRGLTEAQS